MSRYRQATQVMEGFEGELERQKRATPPTPRKLDGEGEAKLLALHLGQRRSAILVFAQQLAKAGIVPDGVEVAVFAHVPEIAIAQLHGSPQRLNGLFGLFQKRVATSQIVMRQGIIRSQTHQAFIDLQALSIAALEGKVVAMHAEDVHEFGMAFENFGEKIKFEFKLADFR